MKDEALKVALEYLKQRELAWNVQIALKEALAAQPAPVQERTDYEVHLHHCNIGECEGVCKYLDDDCPALEHADMKAKWDRPTPPAAQRQWVNLTVDELITLEQKHMRHEDLSQAIEAKLKEKNAAPQPAVPDAFGTREGEHPQYIQGWNDCRAEMLKGMKP
jgi:hypothetical protein